MTDADRSDDATGGPRVDRHGVLWEALPLDPADVTGSLLAAGPAAGLCLVDPAEGRSLPVTGPVRIGSGQRNDLVLRASSVMYSHAVLHPDGSLEVLSPIHTKLDGRPVGKGRHPVAPGARIELGEGVLEVAAAEPPPGTLSGVFDGWAAGERAGAWPRIGPVPVDGAPVGGGLPERTKGVWLVALEGSLATRLPELGWGRACGLVLRSACPPGPLARHLAGLLRVRDPSKRERRWRWFDPRVARTVLPTLDGSQAAALFGVAPRDAEGRWRCPLDGGLLLPPGAALPTQPAADDEEEALAPRPGGGGVPRVTAATETTAEAAGAGQPASLAGTGDEGAGAPATADGAVAAAAADLRGGEASGLAAPAPLEVDAALPEDPIPCATWTCPVCRAACTGAPPRLIEWLAGEADHGQAEAWRCAPAPGVVRLPRRGRPGLQLRPDQAAALGLPPAAGEALRPWPRPVVRELPRVLVITLTSGEAVRGRPLRVDDGRVLLQDEAGGVLEVDLAARRDVAPVPESGGETRPLQEPLAEDDVPLDGPQAVAAWLAPYRARGLEVHVLLDGAATPEAVLDGLAGARPLLRGRLAPRERDLAPALVPAPAGDPQAERLLAEAVAGGWGSVVVAACAADPLVRHLRRLLRVEVEGEPDPLHLRLAAPATLRALLPALAPADVGVAFGAARPAAAPAGGGAGLECPVCDGSLADGTPCAWCDARVADGWLVHAALVPVPAAPPGLAVAYRPGAPAEALQPRPGPRRLRLGAAQLDALVDAAPATARAEREAWLVEHARARYPSRCAALGEEAVRERVRLGLDRARAYRLFALEDVAWLLDALFLGDPDFERSPWGWAWVHALCLPGPPVARLERLMDLVDRELARRRARRASS